MTEAKSGEAAMMDVDVEVLDNRPVGKDLYSLRLLAPQIAKTGRAGQFLNLACSQSSAPLLRRPFSLHLLDPVEGTVSLLYKVVGQGTGLLTELRPGDRTRALGPLGRGFPVTEGLADRGGPLATGGTAILVAGGVGLAPMAQLAVELRQFQAGTTTVLLVGARNSADLPDLDLFRRCGVAHIAVATEDGTAGTEGFVTDILTAALEGRLEGWPTVSPAVAFVCGPRPMLAAVQRLASSHGVGGYLSLEAEMACGIGACLGCVVETTSGYRRVCKDGPVFGLSEVIFDGAVPQPHGLKEPGDPQGPAAERG